MSLWPLIKVPRTTLKAKVRIEFGIGTWQNKHMYVVHTRSFKQEKSFKKTLVTAAEMNAYAIVVSRKCEFVSVTCGCSPCPTRQNWHIIELATDRDTGPKSATVQFACRRFSYSCLLPLYRNKKFSYRYRDGAHFTVSRLRCVTA